MGRMEHSYRKIMVAIKKVLAKIYERVLDLDAAISDKESILYKDIIANAPNASETAIQEAFAEYVDKEFDFVKGLYTELEDFDSFINGNAAVMDDDTRLTMFREIWNGDYYDTTHYESLASLEDNLNEIHSRWYSNQSVVDYIVQSMDRNRETD